MWVLITKFGSCKFKHADDAKPSEQKHKKLDAVSLTKPTSGTASNVGQPMSPLGEKSDMSIETRIQAWIQFQICYFSSSLLPSLKHKAPSNVKLRKIVNTQ